MMEVISKQTVALIDTSVQIDRKKTRIRSEQVESLLAGHFSVTTTIALLEFKATLIQECITIHNLMRRRRHFTDVRDSLLASSHRQTQLRTHIFHNLINVHGESSFTTPSKGGQERLADKARLMLEQVIPELYKWFVTDSVGQILQGPIGCTRAKEEPRMREKAFDVNIPARCKRGHNKDCRVEELIREKGLDLASRIRQLGDEASEQLKRACEVFARVESDRNVDLSHTDCRNAGDALIALEASGIATHALSTNVKEWEPLSKLLGFQFVRVEYPEEKAIREGKRRSI